MLLRLYPQNRGKGKISSILEHTSIVKEKAALIFADKMKRLAEKPERVLTALDDTGPEKLEALRSEKRLAIAEIAGRDSAAAAIAAAQHKAITGYLPTVVYTGTEFGSWEEADRCSALISESVGGLNYHELVIVGSPQLWRAMNGRLGSRFIEKYGVFSPCLGCHLYMHIVRIPLAWQVGAKMIVSGERVSHDGTIKINQSREALEIYGKVIEYAGIELYLPIKDIKEGSDIEAIVGSNWNQDDKQLRCVLSKNYLGLDSVPVVKSEEYLSYLEEFAVPLAKKVIDIWSDSRLPDYEKIALEIAR